MSLAGHSLAAASLAGAIWLAGFVPPDPIPPTETEVPVPTPTPGTPLPCPIVADNLVTINDLSTDNLISGSGINADNLIDCRT